MAESSVFQFKITLKGSKPPIWRRVQVPASCTFWGLHCAIQDSMGWLDSHMHDFEVRRDRIGKVEWTVEREPEEKTNIADYFLAPKDKGTYTYDFGDRWEHTILLEEILPKVEGDEYPKCLAGKRKCPPEDCCGVAGYWELCEAMADPKHKEHKEQSDWLENYYGKGYEFDPEEFDHTEVEFTDPKTSWKWAVQLGKRDPAY